MLGVMCLIVVGQQVEPTGDTSRATLRDSSRTIESRSRCAEPALDTCARARAARTNAPAAAAAAR